MEFFFLDSEDVIQWLKSEKRDVWNLSEGDFGCFTIERRWGSR